MNNYTLITKADMSQEGNRAASMADVLAIGMGLMKNEKPNWSKQVFFTGEIVPSGERCCEDGRKYWKWAIEYEEGFDTIAAAEKRAEELGIKPIVHNHCTHD